MSKLIIAASLTSFFFGLFGVTWEKVDSRIADEFPMVQFVTGEELLSATSSNSGSAPLVFDVRAAEEYAVSHLQNARNATTGAAIASLVADKDAPIVVYCSVGYRSAGVAADLEQRGYTNVRNLHHSLFEWANRGYPMVNAEGDTEQVHPFNRAWGVLLEKPLRSFTP